MNSRFTIYDLRAGFHIESRAKAVAIHQSHIVNRKFSAAKA